MDGHGLESQTSRFAISGQQPVRNVVPTENVKAVLTKKAEWHKRVEALAAAIASDYADEIQALVDPAINKSKVVTIKTVTDELESNLKDILFRQ